MMSEDDDGEDPEVRAYREQQLRAEQAQVSARAQLTRHMHHCHVR